MAGAFGATCGNHDGAETLAEGWRRARNIPTSPPSPIATNTAGMNANQTMAGSWRLITACEGFRGLT